MAPVMKLFFKLPFVYTVCAFLSARRVLVRGRSMDPTLRPGEYALFDCLAYAVAEPQRGDIVLVEDATRSPALLVKRLIALPGDTVVLSGGCWINGVSWDGTPDAPVKPPEAEAQRLEEDQYVVVGDALDASTDSRHFGPVERRQIKGRAWLVYWPRQRFRVIRSPRRMAAEPPGAE